MPRPSDERLARALRESGLEDLAKRAEEGEFNDFFSERHATPKVALVSELAAFDGGELAARVVRGEFDSGKDEADEWYASAEGQEIRNLMEGMT